MTGHPVHSSVTTTTHLLKFYMTMESETATLLVQFTEMCRDDLVNVGTPCGLPCDIFCHTLKADSHTTCRAHAVPLPCRAARGLECVFPI